MELDLRCQSQRYWGFDEREILAPIQRLGLACKSLVDVGANDGYYTMSFLRSHAERVVACEPSPVVNLLLRNAAANGYQMDQQFSVISKPIGRGPGCLSITELVSNLPRPILLKVDIDGGEYDLLTSAENCRFISETRWLLETLFQNWKRAVLAGFSLTGIARKSSTIPGGAFFCVSCVRSLKTVG